MTEISLITTPELLIEAEQTQAFLNFSLSEPPPPEGITVTLNASDLTDFDLSQTQVAGGEITLESEVIERLETNLDATRVTDVPGAAVAIVSPFGSWFGASGVANVEDNIPLEPDDRFEIGSITKTFVATTVLQLVEEGVLTLADTLTDWLPEAVTTNIPNAAEITLEQLLQHTSGVADYVDILFTQAATNPAVFTQDWQPEQLVELIDGIEPFSEPGEAFDYSNTNFLLLGIVIEAATNNNIAAEIRNRIIEPLELDNTFFAEEEEIPGGYVSGYWDFDGDGTLDNINIANLSWAWSSGAMVSNTEDLDTFARNLFTGDLLQPETLEMMLNTIPATGNDNYSSYGLGVGTIESPNRFWLIHRGQTLGYRSNMWYSPQDDLTYIELINGFSTDNLVRDLLPTYREGINDEIFEFTITEPEASISIPVVNDGETEGEEIVTFTLESGEGYEVDAENGVGEFTISETTTGSNPVVSLSGEPDVLVESESTVASLSLSLDSLAEETTVTISSPNLADFDLTQLQIEGGETNLPSDIQSQLSSFLASKVTPQVPGATVRVTTPLGEWTEATGTASIENDTTLEIGDRFEVGSITKTFTATTILQLGEEGLLSLEDTLTDWLPESATENVANSSEITIRQLLNHTSGVAEYDTILLAQAQTNPSILSRDWQPEEIVELIAEAEPFFAPGESWEYSNTNYTLAGMIIEAATGNNLAAEMRSRIIEPLNLDNTFFAEEEEIPEGYVSGYLDFDGDEILDNVSITNLSWSWANGAIVSNTEDLTQYAQALYGGDLLSNAAKEEMYTLVDTGRGYDYGLGMMSFETPDLGIVGHRGGTLGFNANMWYSIEDDFTYVDLANGRTNERLADDIIPAFTEGVIPTVGNIAAYEEFDFTFTEANAAISFPVLDDGEAEGEETAVFGIETGEGYDVNSDASSAEFTILDPEDIVTPPVTETELEPLFGSLGQDVIAISQSSQLLFTGNENDFIDLFLSEGDNRIYAGSGDDTAILGTGDRILGGEGSDRFFATSGGDNTITGGAGADQFWIATASLPDAANVITDFTAGEDVIGIAGLAIGFEDVSITAIEGDALIASSGSDLAILQGVAANSLSADDFAFA